MEITLKQIEAKKPCPGGLKTFKHYFGSSVLVTERNFKIMAEEFMEAQIRWTIFYFHEIIPRKWLLQYPYTAYCLAKDIEGPKDDTRRVSIIESNLAFAYAVYVDRVIRDDTRAAVQNDKSYREMYAGWEEKITNETI